jgi:hypothetical protein
LALILVNSDNLADRTFDRIRQQPTISDNLYDAVTAKKRHENLLCHWRRKFFYSRKTISFSRYHEVTIGVNFLNGYYKIALNQVDGVLKTKPFIKRCLVKTLYI